jgi:hypothetical protein
VRIRLLLLPIVALPYLAIGSPARADDAAATLAERYAPVVRLVAQAKPCGHGEPYEPTNVNRILGNNDVALRGPWDRSNVVKIAPTGRDLSQGLYDYNLDFPGNALTPGCSYDEWSKRINAGHAPTVYAHVVTQRAYPHKLALQYWFFYVFNDFNNKHEGDWEMIQLDFDAATPAEALHRRPALVGYSQHEGAESAHWGDEKLQLVGGTHPVVYPALGSHANYYTSALYLGRSPAQGVGCDDTNRPSRQHRPVVSLIPTGRANYLRTDPWLGFVGRWGEQHRGFYNGPTGPNTKSQWWQPITWADSTWRDASFTVPEGSALGSTATDFFCVAVAATSTVLTAVVGNPSPVLIVLGVVLVLVLWLTSRTTWHPSAPLHVPRRRSWGAILNSARRMYLGHPRLFVGIGLLFIPLGLLISGVQYLVFRVGGLAPLVGSVGPSNAVVGSLALGLGILFTLVGLSIAQATTTIAMNELDAGRDVTAWQAYRGALSTLPSVLIGLVFAAIVVALLDLTTLGGILAVWLVVRWSLLAQVVACEGLKPREALHRSGELVKGHWWRVLSLTVFVSGASLLLGPLVGSLLLFATDASFNFINVVASLVYVILLPFVTISTTYLYFDLKIAKDREERAAAHGEVLPAET